MSQLPLGASAALPLMGTVGPPLPQVVQQDIACRKCGYNLRGLPGSGRCPECGAAVGFSLVGDLMQFSDPVWVRTLSSGSRMILWGIVLTIFCGIGAVVLAATQNLSFLIIAQLGGVAATILMITGWWFVTEPDPSGQGESDYGTIRQAIRIILVISLVQTAMNFGSQALPLPPIARAAVTLIAGLLALVGLVGTILQLYYLQKLTLRIPDPDMSARAKFLKVALPTSWGIVIVAGLITALSIRQAPAMAAFGCFAGLAALALLVFALMYLSLLEKFARRMKREAAIAEQTWASRAAQIAGRS